MTTQNTTAELEAANKKLEVAKSFIRELDEKVAKYESLNIDEVLAAIEKYESLGSVEEILKLKAESKLMTIQSTSIAGKLLASKMKYESEAEENKVAKEATEVHEEEDEQKKADKEAVDLKLESGKKESDEDDYDDEQEEEDELQDLEDEESDNPEVKFESMKRQLDRYRRIGTPSELRGCFSKMESLITHHVGMSEKLESYLELGTPEEIVGVCQEYGKIRTKQESERISTALGIPVEKVISTIEKMESVREAEDLLSDLFKSKSESRNTNEREESTIEKLESGQSLNFGTQKDESSNLENLRGICMKL